MTDKFKIVVTDREVNVEKLKAIGEVQQYEGEGTMPRKLLIEWSKDSDAIFCLLRDRIDKDLLNKCELDLIYKVCIWFILGPRLKVIGTMSVGFEHIDIEECKRR
jgi:glyoxylate/hydroxypyruvate reductase